jgi:hypothetical protein
METAKVDIQKLQMLNDRINQCIDALSQVRMSVHGLSHSPGITPNTATGGFGFQDPRLGPVGAVGFGQQQAGFPQFQPGFYPQPFVTGLSHSPLVFGGQAGINPYFAQAGVNPYAGVGGIAGAHNPYAAFPVGVLGQWSGLSHTSAAEPLEAYLRPTWSDPLLAARVAQTFPYAQLPVPPVVQLY